MRAICAIVKGKPVICSNTGRSRIRR